MARKNISSKRKKNPKKNKGNPKHQQTHSRRSALDDEDDENGQTYDSIDFLNKFNASLGDFSMEAFDRDAHQISYQEKLILDKQKVARSKMKMLKAEKAPQRQKVPDVKEFI